MADKMLKIELKKSLIGRGAKQIATAEALGLKKPGDVTAAPGTGMIAGGPVRAVIEAAGIKDIRAKSMRSNNPINVVSATFAGLCGLVSAESVAEKRGKTVKEILG